MKRENPADSNSPSNLKETKMKEQVQAAIDKIRPMLKADGGDVELLEVTDGIVKVRLQGACAGCPMSQMTLKNGIERMLKKEVPGVKSVVSA
jgi:Fe-S cluster biogenesis protein NfuA